MLLAVSQPRNHRLTDFWQFARHAPITSMCASGIANLPRTCDRSPTPFPVLPPLLPSPAAMIQAIASLELLKAVPPNPLRLRHPSQRPDRKNHRMGHTYRKPGRPPRGIRRRARIGKQNLKPPEIVQKAVSCASCGKDQLSMATSVIAILTSTLCPGRTSVSSSNRTHVPYFRYFGPTAIVPGFKQMVRLLAHYAKRPRF